MLLRSAFQNLYVHQTSVGLWLIPIPPPPRALPGINASEPLRVLNNRTKWFLALKQVGGAQRLWMLFLAHSFPPSCAP